MLLLTVPSLVLKERTLRSARGLRADSILLVRLLSMGSLINLPEAGKLGQLLQVLGFEVLSGKSGAHDSGTWIVSRAVKKHLPLRNSI